MNIHELLDEYNLEPDDIRWSLCLLLTESIVNKMDTEGPLSVTRDFWSGIIGDKLYDLEERWIRDRGESLNRSILDEGHLRDELSQMSLDKINRRQH